MSSLAVIFYNTKYTLNSIQITSIEFAHKKSIERKAILNFHRCFCVFFLSKNHKLFFHFQSLCQRRNKTKKKSYFLIAQSTSMYTLPKPGNIFYMHKYQLNPFDKRVCYTTSFLMQHWIFEIYLISTVQVRAYRVIHLKVDDWNSLCLKISLIV